MRFHYTDKKIIHLTLQPRKVRPTVTVMNRIVICIIILYAISSRLAKQPKTFKQLAQRTLILPNWCSFRNCDMAYLAFTDTNWSNHVVLHLRQPPQIQQAACDGSPQACHDATRATRFSKDLGGAVTAATG